MDRFLISSSDDTVPQDIYRDVNQPPIKPRLFPGDTSLIIWECCFESAILLNMPYLDREVSVCIRSIAEK